jgi:thiol-disulfide isomerase/thioredoxin
MKTLKQIFIIVLNLLVPQLLISQAEQVKSHDPDPFCSMIKTIYSFNALSFDSQSKIKNVFESDTITKYAKVNVLKKGNKISFLRIIPLDEQKELLFCHDTAWVADHVNKILHSIGTSTDDLNYNEMSQFFPFSLFNVDTLISQGDPFWKIIKETENYYKVMLDISSSSKDMSEIRVEYTISKSGFLPCKTLQESVYLNVDKIIQEQNFSNYSIPRPEEIKIPEYFTDYKKDFSILKKRDSVAENSDKEPPEDIYLQNIELCDLSGNPYNLPDNGLIFIDLWYVGCSPCMKSAPVIERLYMEYRDNIHFISVNETDQDIAKIKLFKEKMGITFPVVTGGEEKLSVKMTGSKAYPLFILVDARTRKVLWKLVGYTENLEELIIEAIKKYS